MARYSVSLDDVVTALRNAGIPVLEPHSVILHLGCGTSTWGAQLAEAGHVVLDSDIDFTLLESLRARSGSSRGHLFAVLDATCPAARAGSVSYVLEKGTLDALHCAPGEQGATLVRQTCAHALRLLRPGGSILCVSARPNDLLACLSNADGGETIVRRIVPCGGNDGTTTGVLVLTPRPDAHTRPTV